MVRPYIKGLVLLSILLALASVGFAQEGAHGATAVVSTLQYRALPVGIACSSVALGVALVGYAAANAVGRNPGASGEILKISIIGMAFVEAIAFYVLFLLK